MFRRFQKIGAALIGSGALVAAAVAGGGGLSPGSVFADGCTADNSPQTTTSGGLTTVTFCYNGHDSVSPSQQTWTVPAGVTTITVTADGAQGANGGFLPGGVEGNEYTAVFAVTPTQQFTIEVGGQGGQGRPHASGEGGWLHGQDGVSGSSGGAGGGGGGGATAIWDTSTANHVLYLAAGGGGGGGGNNMGNLYVGGGGGGGGGGYTYSTASGTSVDNGANGTTGEYAGMNGGQGSDFCNSAFVIGSCGAASSEEWSGDGQLTITYVTPIVTTTTTLASDHNPSVYGQPVTFTATVSPDPTADTGTVAFMRGPLTITGCGAQTITSNGNGTASATCTITDFSEFHGLSMLYYAITAAYTDTAASPGFQNSTSTILFQTIGPSATSTVIDVQSPPGTDVTSLVYGQPITLLATVAEDGDGTINPGDDPDSTQVGTVTFQVDGTDITGCTAQPIAATTSQATCTVPQGLVHAGSHDFKAIYSGSQAFVPSPYDFLPSNDTTGAFPVNKAATTTTLASDHNPSVYGQPVTFTATVSPDPTADTGTVAFKVGATTITGCGAQMLTSTAGVATATCTITDFSQFHASGTAYSITAAYTDTAATPDFSNSTSAALNQSVNKADTSVALTSDHNPSVYGQYPTFTATVTADSPSTLNPGNRGTVTFTDTTTGTVLCTSVALSGNQAICHLSGPQLVAFHAGNHTIVASYTDAGDTPVDYNDSTGSLVQSVHAAGTTTTASAAYYDWAPVPTVAITANVVANAPSILNPSDIGTVSFFNGATLLCTVPLDDGQALCISAIDPATTSPHSLTAIYNYHGLSTADYATSSATTDAVPYFARPTLVSVTTVYPDDGSAWLVQGGGFSGASSVTVCGIAVPFTVVNDYTMLIGIPNIVGPQQCVITVTAAGGTGSSNGTVTVVPEPLPGAPVVVFPTGPTTPSTPTPTPTPTCDTVSLTLTNRWTLVAWPGADGISVVNALAGGDCGNDVTAKVSVVWGFDSATQTYQAFFPGSANVPGLNDLSTLKFGLGYWVGLNDPSTPVTWTVEKG